MCILGEKNLKGEQSSDDEKCETKMKKCKKCMRSKYIVGTSGYEFRKRIKYHFHVRKSLKL
jgi:hypothetical protein